MMVFHHFKISCLKYYLWEMSFTVKPNKCKNRTILNIPSSGFKGFLYNLHQLFAGSRAKCTERDIDAWYVSYMVDPHGVPWPAFWCALPGSHCWEPVVAASTGGGPGATQGLYHPPTPALGKHPRTSTQKMGLAQKLPKKTLKAMFVTRIPLNNYNGKFVRQYVQTEL